MAAAPPGVPGALGGGAFPARWGGRGTGMQDTAADYEADPRVGLRAAHLLALPTVSLVTAAADMFGPRGVYNNRGARNVL